MIFVLKHNMMLNLDKFWINNQYKFWEDFGFWGKFGKNCINFGKILDFGKNLD